MVQANCTMYEMLGCGYCKKAHDLLKGKIADGSIEVKSLSDAPKSLNLSGAPSFVSLTTGKVSVGLPESYNNLQEKLGHSLENFQQHRAIHRAMHQTTPYKTLNPGRLGDPNNTLRWYQAGVL